MKVLITGVAGFIGYSISDFLLKKKFNIIGLDSLNNYYNLKLKKKRLSNLKKNNNFHFLKLNLNDRKNLFKKLKKYKIDLVIHLAAQPGVRYSLKFPKTYVDNNISAFANLLDFVKLKKTKLIYASSSSVYGDTKKFPVSENDLLMPNNIYALTKKNNEEMAKLYSKFYSINIVGLRFFTVYGEWGRPDMFILKFLNFFKNNKKFPLFNNGNHYRDFTYVDDLMKMIFPIIKNIKKYNKGHYIFNVCTGKSLNIKKILNLLINLTKYKKINHLGYQKTEVKKTHGSNKKILKLSKKIKFTDYNVGVYNTYKWFLKNKKLF
mgnify:CR=1 FL=1